MLSINFFVKSNAQLLQFSQLFNAQLELNPAFSGRFEGDMKFSYMYRSFGYDISDAYKTSFISYEKPFYIKKQYLNFGLFYKHDNSAGNTFPIDEFSFSVAKEIPVMTNISLKTGISIAYVLRQISSNSLIFPDQYNRETGSFDPSVTSMEPLEIYSSDNFNIGTGIIANKTFRNGSFNMGASIFNINSPNYSFYGEEFTLPIEFIYHLKADLSFQQNIFIIPTYYSINQGKAKELLLGSLGGIDFKHEKIAMKNIVAGIHIRASDFFDPIAYIVSVGTTLYNYRVLMSMDIGVNYKRSNTSQNMAFEASIAYILPSLKSQNRYVPCERY